MTDMVSRASHDKIEESNDSTEQPAKVKRVRPSKKERRKTKADRVREQKAKKKKPRAKREYICYIEGCEERFPVWKLARNHMKEIHQLKVPKIKRSRTILEGPRAGPPKGPKIPDPSLNDDQNNKNNQTKTNLGPPSSESSSESESSDSDSESKSPCKMSEDSQYSNKKTNPITLTNINDSNNTNNKDTK